MKKIEVSPVQRRFPRGHVVYVYEEYFPSEKLGITRYRCQSGPLRVLHGHVESKNDGRIITALGKSRVVESNKEFMLLEPVQ
jgi:hypothetical protein